MSTLLTMSLTGGAMILVIALLRFVLQRYLHRTVFVLLWCLVLLRLVVPVFVSSPSSIYRLLPDFSQSEAVHEQQSVQTQGIQTMTPVPLEDSPVIIPVEEDKGSLLDYLPLLWAAGCAFLLGRGIYVHLRARGNYRHAVPVQESGLEGLRVCRLEGLQAPLVFGLWKPTILLPTTFPEEGSEEYWHVLHHEQCHVRNGDLWIKLAALVTVAVHWFNPLVWLLLVLLSEDMEMRCDEQVIAKCGKKKGYAKALVQAEMNRMTQLLEACFAFSATERRIKTIAKAKPGRIRSILFGGILGLCLLFCFSTMPMSEAASVVPETEQSATLPTELPTVPAEPATEELLTIAPTQQPTEETVPTEEATTETMETEAEQTEATEEIETEAEQTEATEEIETFAEEEDWIEESTYSKKEPEYPYLGNFTVLVGDTVRRTFDGKLRFSLSVSDPSLIRANKSELTGPNGTSSTITFTAYTIGYAELYATGYIDGEYQSWLYATVNIEPREETEQIGFAELDGKTPEIVIPEFDFPLP